MTKSDAASRGRFKPGKSGNPRGRPTKVVEAHASAFNVIIDRTLTITRNGVAREVSMEEALQHRTYQDAIGGKRLAQREVLKWVKRREAWIAKHLRPPTLSVEIKQTTDPTNAITALLILGIATPDTDVAKYGASDQCTAMLLESWAVQMALIRRRSASPIDKNEHSEIVHRTRDASSLRWPGGSRK